MQGRDSLGWLPSTHIYFIFNISFIDEKKTVMEVKLLTLILLTSAVYAKPKRNGTDILLSKTEATTFGAKRSYNYPDRTSVRNGLVKECCDKDCKSEEIAEFKKQSPFSLDEVKRLTCRISLRENHDCRCDGEICGRSYYRAGICPITPCKEDEYHCHNTPSSKAFDQTTCLPQSYKCNFWPDCPNHEDEYEPDCRVTTQTSQATIEANTVLKDGMTTKTSGYYGNLFINKRPVCAKGWGNTENSATLFCKTLAKNPKKYYPYSENVQGKLLGPTHQSIIISQYYIMSDVSCSGSETFIGDCSHKTYNPDCYQGKQTAFIACLDSASTTLDGSRSNFEGRASLVDQPLVIWGNDKINHKNIAKVTCNSIHGDRKFKDREKGVPMFSFEEVTNRLSSYCTFVDSCTGNEAALSECTLHFARGDDCRETRQLKVTCAKCDATKLVEIVNTITYEGDISSVKTSIETARQKLKRDCREWTDCDENFPQFKEYCRVKFFLDEAFLTLTSSEKSDVIRINTNTDHLKKLELEFLEQGFSELNQKVDEMGREIVTQLGDYFKRVADFDQDQAHIDVAASLGLYNGAKDTLAEVTSELGPQINDILNIALISAIGTVAEKAIHVGLAIASTCNPVEYLTETAGPIADLYNAITDLAVASLKVAEVAQVGKLLENAASAVKVIHKGISDNENIYAMSRAILGEERKELDVALSSSNAKKFLVHYNNFNPAVTNDKVAEYGGYIEQIIDTACGIILDPQSTAATVGGAFAVGTNVCPKAQVNIARIVANFEAMQDRQEEIMDGLARVARSSITAASASNMKTSLEGSLAEKVERAIVDRNSLIVFRVHKSMLVDNACNYLTYINHGTESSECARLRSNPEGKVKHIISTRTTNMCAVSNAEKLSQKLKIPIDVKKAPGILNYDALIRKRSSEGTRGHATFRIPNKQWLLDNKWIEGDQEKTTENFYIEKINVLLPPSSPREHKVNLKITFKKNKIGSKRYTINGGQRITIRYKENAASGCKNSQDSLYTVPSCGTNYGKTCFISEGHVPGDLLPSMVGTQWDFKVNSNFQLLKMYPAQPTYIYAQIDYCAIAPVKKKKKAAQKTFKKAAKNASKRQTGSHVVCCSKQSPKMFYTPSVTPSQECQECPANSEPRLFDHYCEKCPAGYETSEYLFGCQPCGENKFKAEAGPGKCADCPAGEVARGTGFTACYVEAEE